MFVVNDSDTPIEVAQKIICGTRDKTEPGTLLDSLNKAFGVSNTPDMFSDEEISEIADYLNTYLKHNSQIPVDFSEN